MSHHRATFASMLGCGACGRIGDGSLCGPCRRTIARGPTIILRSGIVVRSGLAHHGVARRLVHNLKYRGITGVASVLAAAMAARVEAGVPGLVPLPRARLRRARYGVDPAVVLARDVARRCHLPVFDVLRPALWWPRHASREPERRSPPRFRAVAPVPPGVWLIDDVARTGSTLEAGAVALGVAAVQGLVATAPSTMRVSAWRPPGRLHSGETADNVG